MASKRKYKKTKPKFTAHELAANLKRKVANFKDTDEMKAYLNCIGSFRHYSWGNRFLIFMHQPESTLVAGFQQWKKNYNRHVIKGAKGIPIRVPKYFVKEDEETGEKVKVTYFGVEYVYDVSQTEGDDLPS